MTDKNARAPGTQSIPAEAAGPRGATGTATTELLEDWVTIWQSELAGLVLDREMQDVVLRVIDGWASQSRAVLRMLAPLMEGSGDGPSAAGPDAATRATALAAAPDERDALIRDLLERVSDLERRLAAGEPAAH